MPCNHEEPFRRVNEIDFQKLMNFAFSQVCNEKDWKAPIRVLVPLELAPLYARAIEYMTATKPSIMEQRKDELGRDVVLLIASGYRAGPAGP